MHLEQSLLHLQAQIRVSVVGPTAWLCSQARRVQQVMQLRRHKLVSVCRVLCPQTKRENLYLQRHQRRFCKAGGVVAA